MSLALGAQADALEIEAQAKRRLADEYDAAQQRGEVQTAGGARGNQHGAIVPDGNIAKVTDLGLTRKQVHEARQLRDAEAAAPGVIRHLKRPTLSARITADATIGDATPFPLRRPRALLPVS